MLLRPIKRALGPLMEHEQLLMISISTVLVMAGQGVIAPILPLFGEQLGVTAAVIGLTLSVFALARLILNVPLGILSDRYGRRFLLISGPLVTAVGMIGSGFSIGIWDLLAWRFIAGAGSAMYMTGAQVYLADISTPQNRARFIGTNQGALLFGTSIGPAIGGIVAEFWGLRAPFHVVGVAAIVATVYAYLRLPETRHLSEAAPEVQPVKAGERAPRSAIRQFALSRDFLTVSAVTLGIFFTRTASRQTIMPLLASARFGFSAGALGALFTVMSLVNLALIPFAAWTADRFGRKAAIVPSGLIVAASLVVIGLAPTTAFFVGGGIILAIGTSIAGPAPAAYVADIAPGHVRGMAMGLYRTSGDVGFLIGPPILGFIADVTSYGWALAVNAVLMALLSLLFLTARETVKRTPAPEPAPAQSNG